MTSYSREFHVLIHVPCAYQSLFSSPSRMKRSGLALTHTMIQAYCKFSPTALLFEEGLSYFEAMCDDIPQIS